MVGENMDKDAKTERHDNSASVQKWGVRIGESMAVGAIDDSAALCHTFLLAVDCYSRLLLNDVQKGTDSLTCL